ncbi:E3 ubiquitin-protein ligase MPSR1 [Cardamine amara subsp. amara]|uniref:RING-type E3 ubiquitin transferase n=1 Tax=Cardamine amara subsp. amara TaxID=228776 RepID=A0ABD1A6P1_CARAN
MVYIVDDVSDSSCLVEAFYYSEEATQDLLNKQNFLFDFEVEYTKVPEPDSDGEADYMDDGVETRIINQSQEYGRDWFIGQDDEQLKGTIYAILYEIGVPPYRGIMTTFTEDIKSIINLPLEKLEKIKVTINVVADLFPEDEVVEVEDVNYSVGGASVEAMEQHLEILTVNESVGECVICLETIQVGSDFVGRMPCTHAFHLSCIEKWLERTGICPLCRDVFPV